jgi:hypothetical protein
VDREHPYNHRPAAITTAGPLLSAIFGFSAARLSAAVDCRTVSQGDRIGELRAAVTKMSRG